VRDLILSRVACPATGVSLTNRLRRQYNGGCLAAGTGRFDAKALLNAVAPGSMDTEMVREMSTPENMERERQGVPLRRLGTAQDEASLVVFLYSDASSYITGATVDINGGDLMM
jgi:NAD(P)-dependent dehydrogenase (short-subunit alcohol dehydrogenase family)